MEMKYPVITLCGSTRFKDKFMQAQNVELQSHSLHFLLALDRHFFLFILQNTVRSLLEEWNKVVRKHSL